MENVGKCKGYWRRKNNAEDKTGRWMQGEELNGKVDARRRIKREGGCKDNKRHLNRAERIKNCVIEKDWKNKREYLPLALYNP